MDNRCVKIFDLICVDPGRVLLHTIAVVNIYEMHLSGAVYALLGRVFLIIEEKDGALSLLLEDEGRW